MFSVLGLIPARSGSKRIINKNIKKLNNIPLIAYTIRAALKSKLLDKIVVSTDDVEIARIARRYGAEVPFLRPEEYAQDDSSDIMVLQHALKKLPNYSYVTYLRPTTPFKTNKIIDYCLIRLLWHKEFSCIRTVSKVRGNNHPYWMFKKNNDLLEPFIKNINMIQYHQSQLLPECYKVNGVVDVFKSEWIKQGNQYGDKIGYYEIIKPYQDIDIDEEDDFFFCEYLLRTKKI